MKQIIIIMTMLLIVTSVYAATCGDNYCEPGESSSCSKDCAYNNLCGNGVCSGTEQKDNCPLDCWKTSADYVSSARNMQDVYHTYDEVVNLMKALEQQYPKYMKHEIIGKSLQGKDIYMFKVGNPNGGGRFMFDGRVHGMEDCGTESGYAFIKWVLSDSSTEAQNVKNYNELFFIPGINIDSTRRQNMRREYSDGTKVLYGVDMNRNGITGWGTSGSSDVNAAQDYRGKSGNSEPETKAVYDAIQKYKPKVYMNVHCGMEMSHYHSLNALTQTVITKMTANSAKYNTQTMTKYPPSSGCAGGYICTMGSSVSGASAWIHETSTWGHLPKSLSEYLTKWYTQDFPIYLSMSEAVQNTSATWPIIDPPVDPPGNNSNRTLIIVSASSIGVIGALGFYFRKKITKFI